MKSEKDPEVVIMGEEISSHHHHHHHHNVVWGAFLIFAGVIFLLNTTGVVPWEAWQNLWVYWPMLVILAGVKIMLGRSFFSRIILIILSLIFFGLVFLSILDQFAPNLVSHVPPGIMQYVSFLERMQP
jgi:hypothetical protein